MMNCAVKFRLLKLGLCLVCSPSEETHWVRCNGHGCLALVDRQGMWKCFATGRNLIGLAPMEGIKPR